MKFLPKNNAGFTLVEIILAMTVFAIIMTSVLLSVETLSITRIKTENRVKLLEELYFFSEQLIANVKEWWTVDYEEYWNRKSYSTVVWSGNVIIGQISWTYTLPTWVGNYGSWWSIGTSLYGSALYYCASWSWTRMWTWWCLTWFNKPSVLSWGVAGSYSSKYQRYWQYILQYMDHNSNFDSDWWDEDGIGWIIGDEDDKDIWNWPTVLSWSTPELYLINPLEKTRLYFRYIVRKDPGTTDTCTISSTWVLSSWCMWNVQILRMNWLDIGYAHTGASSDGSAFDWKVDTWILHPNWTGTGPIVPWWTLATGHDDEWVDLFPNTINVKSLKFYVYPEKDPWISWYEKDCTVPACTSPFIHPYVRIQMTVWFTWWKRRVLKNDDPTISINTTVTLWDRE